MKCSFIAVALLYSLASFGVDTLAETDLIGRYTMNSNSFNYQVDLKDNNYSELTQSLNICPGSYYLDQDDSLIMVYNCSEDSVIALDFSVANTTLKDLTKGIVRIVNLKDSQGNDLSIQTKIKKIK